MKSPPPLLPPHHTDQFPAFIPSSTGLYHGANSNFGDDDLAGWGIEQATSFQSSHPSSPQLDDDDQFMLFDGYFDETTPRTGTPESSTATHHPHTHTAQMRGRHRSTKSQTILHPLMLASGLSRSVPRERLKTLTGQGVRSSLTANETAVFLEHFRYIQVSSALLDKNPYAVRPGAPPPKLGSKKSACFCHTDSSTDQRSSSDGCRSVIVMLVMIAFAARSGYLSGEESGIQARLVVNYGRILYLFAYARRAALRRLRARVLANSMLFVRHSQTFDSTLSFCISLIRQSEENESRPDQVVAGKHLRSSASASLYLCISSCLQAIQELLPHCPHGDLDKYLDIYEVDMAVIGQFGWEVIQDRNEQYNDNRYSDLVHAINVPRAEFFGPIGAHASVQKLKFDMFKLHFLRRLFICCMISLDSAGVCTNKELGAWSTVETQLNGFASLVKHATRTLLPKQVVSVFNTTSLSYTNESPADYVWQHHVRSLNTITSSLRNMELRLDDLRDTSITLISNPTALDNYLGTTSSPGLETDCQRHYDMIGNDLKALLTLWESGKQQFEEALDNQRKSRASNPATATATPSLQSAPMSPSYSNPNALLSPVSASARKGGDVTSRSSPAMPAKRFDFMAHHRRQSSEWTSLSGATAVLDNQSSGNSSSGGKGGLGITGVGLNQLNIGQSRYNV